VPQQRWRSPALYLNGNALPSYSTNPSKQKSSFQTNTCLCLNRGGVAQHCILTRALFYSKTLAVRNLPVPQQRWHSPALYFNGDTSPSYSINPSKQTPSFQTNTCLCLNRGGAAQHCILTRALFYSKTLAVRNLPVPQQRWRSPGLYLNGDTLPSKSTKPSKQKPSFQTNTCLCLNRGGAAQHCI